MNERQEHILRYITEDYIRSAMPVASKTLVKQHKFALSSATIRNEMAQLEDEGYVTQPHTSAGRIPTLTGLKYYIDHLFTPRELSRREEERFHEIFRANGLRGIARRSAELCLAAIVTARDNRDFYYTGFSYLFNHPEFNDYALVQTISIAVDKLEDLLPYFYDNVHGDEPKIFLGKGNPLGNSCSVCFVSGNEKHPTLFGMITPLRTDYSRNIGLLKSVSKYL